MLSTVLLPGLPASTHHTCPPTIIAKLAYIPTRSTTDTHL
jgi:hypothetical protein